MAGCYCGKDTSFEQCCGPIIDHREKAETAEQLMRSRYSAFVVQDERWLLESWHAETRPSRVRFDNKQQWIGLQIKNTQKGSKQDSTGEVEFVARFKVDGKAVRLHENSRFEFIEGQWFYKDGDHLG